jgi:glycosyltransferase involved in cell wall biosynthesis
MISVVIATLDDAPTLTDALAALIPAAVDGLVREVIVVDGGSTDQTLEIADDCGARILRVLQGEAARVAMGCDMARGDWLLVLDPGAAPPRDWDRAVLDHVREHPGHAAWWGVRRLWRGPDPRGVLVSRERYAAKGLSLRGARRLKS